MKSPKSSSFKFTVSHPAQTVYRILGGGRPIDHSRAKEALRKAKEKRLGKDVNRGTD